MVETLIRAVTPEGKSGRDTCRAGSKSDCRYPARLEVDYPESLSRGLVLVKWWLLALPHDLVVAVFVERCLGDLDGHRQSVDLELRRPGRPAYDFVLGMNRWVFRVTAYASLLTDAYPPFRLDLGGNEPPTDVVPVTVPPAPAPAIS